MMAQGQTRDVQNVKAVSAEGNDGPDGDEFGTQSEKVAANQLITRKHTPGSCWEISLSFTQKVTFYYCVKTQYGSCFLPQ